MGLSIGLLCALIETYYRSLSSTPHVMGIFLGFTSSDGDGGDEVTECTVGY